MNFLEQLFPKKTIFFFFFLIKTSKQWSQPQTRIRQIKLFIELFLEQMRQRRQNIKKYGRKRCFALI